MKPSTELAHPIPSRSYTVAKVSTGWRTIGRKLTLECKEGKSGGQSKTDEAVARSGQDAPIMGDTRLTHLRAAKAEPTVKP